MSTPELHLKTAYILNWQGRILSTREPGASSGPLFSLVRSAACCAWAIRADVPQTIASEIDCLARNEPPLLDLQNAPIAAEQYKSLLRRRATSGCKPTQNLHQSGGPMFTFPNSIANDADVVTIEDERLLEQNFRGWVPGEITAGRSPVMAIVQDGSPISVCFCARRSNLAAEAGLETAETYRGRGFAQRVTAAWACAIRALGLVPLYSTSWNNEASLAVARKLRLTAYASYWSLSD